MTTVSVKYVGSEYFEKALIQTHKLVRQAKKTLELEGVEFEAFACRGVSGMAFAPVLAYAMKKRLIITRKTIEGCHASSYVEAAVVEGDRYIFVDDFRSSGGTIGRTNEAILGHLGGYLLEYVGAYLYNYDDFIRTSLDGIDTS